MDILFVTLSLFVVELTQWSFSVAKVMNSCDMSK